MSSRARKRGRQKKSLAFHIGTGIVAAVLAILSIGVVAGYGLVSSWLTDLPDYTAVDAFNMPQKTRIYAADGQTLLAELFLEDREPVTIDQVCDDLKNATVATEDERFYEHEGVDVAGILRALVVNFTSGGTREGASTITQQFVRNTLLIDEMSDISVKRKVREAYIALQIEKIYNKDEILMMYLNTINYGDGAYGVESAARHYYSKHASELTLDEAALIAGIPQSPTNNNPKTNPENALARRNLVLDRMLSNGYINQEQHDAAQAMPLTLVPSEQNLHEDGIYAYPYFTTWVRKLLLEDYSTDQVFKGGMTVYTTLDVAKQQAAEDAAAAKLRWMDDDVEVSITSIDPDTGYVVALVGGRDYYQDQFNLATQAQRQAGSCFKMFTLVAAIEHGISPSTLVNCASPITFDDWRVENYGGATYGTMTIQSATQISSNTAYARLIHLLGPEAAVDVATRMGVRSPLEAVPSITLGSQGVNTLDMASAYGTLATGGIYHAPKFITKIVASDGTVLYDAATDMEGVQAISPETAHAAVEVLKTVVTGGTATSAQLYGQVSAGKTGTSQNYRDSMYCGITPQLSTAVWIGSRSDRPVPDNMGGSNCCPVWRNYMSAALEGMPYENFPTAPDPTYDPSAAAELNEGGFTSETRVYTPPVVQQEEEEEEEAPAAEEPAATPEPAPAPAPAPEPAPAAEESGGGDGGEAPAT